MSPWSSRTVVFRRLAEAHTPITDFGSAGSVGFKPSRVSIFFGIFSAMVCTLAPRVASTPGAFGVGIRCRLWNGRRSPRSKIDPRST
jgi:hypothetical protein